MAQPATRIFIDGSFEELADELAVYIDNVKEQNVRSEVKACLEAKQKDEALKKLVTASAVLNAAPEKELMAAYHLLIYLLTQSPNVNQFLRRVCENISRPIASSPQNGNGMSLSLLSTLFNTLKTDNDVRFNVFQSILRLVKSSKMYEVIKPQLSTMDQCVAEWDLEEDQRKLFSQIADVASEAGEEE
jgi:translation initiation factor 3 subunit M